MPYIKISEDYQFHYVLVADRDRPTILFLHGFMGDCNDFSGIVERLREFNCLLVDLPGHGKTEVSCDANYQMANLGSALIELLERFEISCCLLLGYSMGGRLALYLAVHFPTYFQAVILESASPGLKTQAEKDARIDRDLQLAQQLETEDLASFLQRWYANPLFKSFVRHPDYQKSIARRLKNDPHKLAKSLLYMGLGIQPALWDKLAEIQIPLVLIVGEWDTKFMTINRAIANSCLHSSLNIVINSGHNVHLEQPDLYSNLVKYWAEDR